MQTETASALAETEGGREICTGNLQYTLPVASSRSISSLKCRDMRGRPSIYAFYGIIGVHISFGITCGCRCGGPMWYSRSFADAQDDKSGFVRDDKSRFVQDEGAVFRSGFRGVRWLYCLVMCAPRALSRRSMSSYPRSICSILLMMLVPLADIAASRRAIPARMSGESIFPGLSWKLWS